MFNKFNYETSAYELADHIPKGVHVWTTEDLLQELHARIAEEKARRELHVYYYRIGHTLAFQLPLEQLPNPMPAGISGTAYPWNTWLAWSLRERWDLLYTAWRRFNDQEAARMLQKELAALYRWDNRSGEIGDASLCTGHIAACLANFLSDETGWDPDDYQAASAAARSLLERDLWPWYQKIWLGKEISTKQLLNINCIVLFGFACLTKVAGSAHSAEIEKTAREVLKAWCELRFGDEHFSEGTSYDGFMLDSLTEWMNTLPDRAELALDSHEAFASFQQSCIQLSLPGRLDLHAPLGDVEPEMPFWMNVISRFTEWYGCKESVWLLRRIPPVRMPAKAMDGVLHIWQMNRTDLRSPELGVEQQPESTCFEHPSAVTMRTGWKSSDCVVAVGLTRNEGGHLHSDNGHIIIGAYDRFWITDPGYQQYRPGIEREFTLGVEAHNAPVIEGVAQTRRAAELLTLETDNKGRRHTRIELTHCYDNLPPETKIQRDIWLTADASKTIVVIDTIHSAKKELQIGYSWQGGTHLAWAFKHHWARLSDGKVPCG